MLLGNPFDCILQIHQQVKAVSDLNRKVALRGAIVP